jgi:hypothetical protein
VAPVATFLALTVTLSAPTWLVMIREGSISGAGGVYVMALMWAPGVCVLDQHQLLPVEGERASAGCEDIAAPICSIAVHHRDDDSLGDALSVDRSRV